jgi:hypothetical protein
MNRWPKITPNRRTIADKIFPMKDIFGRKLPRRFSIILLLASTVYGCVLNQPASPQFSAPGEITISKALQNKLYDLEDLADTAITLNQLTYPTSGSAVFFYRQMLSLDPGNQNAIRGLERVIEAYIALAISAADDNLFAKARSMLARAKLIDSKHPSLAPTLKQIQLLEAAKRRKIQFTKEEIFSVGGTAKINSFLANEHPNCRYSIAVSNDAQGRWIYKTLKKNSLSSRPKAKIIIASPTSLEQICLINPK